MEARGAFPLGYTCLSGARAQRPAEGLNTRFKSVLVCVSPKVDFHDSRVLEKETYVRKIAQGSAVGSAHACLNQL